MDERACTTSSKFYILTPFILYYLFFTLLKREGFHCYLYVYFSLPIPNFLRMYFMNVSTN